MNIRLGTVFGVEVGPQAVKVAELRFSIRKFELVNFQETPYRTAENGELLVSETLQTLFQKKRSRKRVIASLPGDSVAFRFITFPFLEKKK
ncbi:MAG: hypothetical protein ACE5FU_14750 [Nitrospinota bacterium]